MADSRNRDFCENDRNDGDDSVVEDQYDGVEFDDSSSASSGAGSASRSQVGLEERLTEILVEERDGDLLLQQNNREERVLQWLMALDMQVIGACRTDERLKPLLKMNASNGAAEDRLLAHLSQHFEPAEVGMLARCFCIPLVSIRVGKINKQGTLLCPTAARGNLNLTVLPTSDLRLSFVGDDGHTERLVILSSQAHCSAITIEDIAADSSGRSFLIKVPDSQMFYFWCSEKSKLLGKELLAKMKDLLSRRPSIAELTGISNSRLGCFATQLRAYLVGSTTVGTPVSLTASHMHQDARIEQSDSTNQDGQFSSVLSKSVRLRHPGSQAIRPNSSFQGSLSPRSSSFKEGMSRNLSSLKNSAREMLRRRGDSHPAVDNLTITSVLAPDGALNHFENDKVPETIRSLSIPSSSFLESLGNLSVPPTLSSDSQIPFIGTSLLSPYYCWCPPGSSTLQCSAEPIQFPSSSMECPLLPPLSSLLPSTISSSLLTQTPPFNLVDSPSLDFPAFLPDPLVRFPRPTTQQIPTFTPLMCDPIVHIPVIDVCSSGQGYLVSAGPAMSTAIPPLHPNLVNPLIPETNSMVEKGARETLRMLISSSSQNMHSQGDENPGMIVGGSRGLYGRTMDVGVIVAGSRGLFGGSRDVGVIASSIAAIGLVSLSGRSDGDSHGHTGLHEEESYGYNGSCSDDEE
ncbi:uncharacterized protein LOC133798318 [Humulus lupulus]|uniref:uncharacterized protein LOC133798318 n=1 Tax=Humulus lupulus TaxID=3486 RepID=UPI002B405947|nr:uncharacterized protein LOC133798318 [Humulus lupulus]